MPKEKIKAGPIAHSKNHEKYSVKYQTLVDALRTRVALKPDFLVYMDMKNQPDYCSAPEVVEHAEEVAWYLMSRGLNKNDKVVVMLPTGREFAYVYFGILIAGGVPVPVSQPAGTSQIEKYLDNLSHIIHDCEARFFVTYDKIKLIAGSLMSIRDLVNGFILTDEIFGSPVPEADRVSFPALSAEDFALIQYTSGTTGKPKGVMLSHRNLIHNIHGIGVASRMTDSDVGISWLPMYHDMGLIGGFLTCLYWNLLIILMQPEAFLFRPHWWMENISRFRVTMGVAPNFGYHYCVTRIPDGVVQKLDMSSWRLALNGAEPIDRITLTKFVDKFKPAGLRDDIFLPVYGMAENSLAATFPLLERTTVVHRFNRQLIEDDHMAVDSTSTDTREFIDLVSVGVPLVGQEVRIVDESGKTIKERQIGEILVKSPSLTSGYYKNEKATGDTIKDGWLYTGDLGFILDGMLFISGRKKEMIIKRGKNIYPYDVERIASSVKGIRLGCVAAFAIHNEHTGTEDLILVCETTVKNKGEHDAIVKAISSELVQKLGISPDDIRLVPKGTIPKTTSGKIQRILCKKIYLQEELVPSRSRNTLLLIKTFAQSQINLMVKKLRKGRTPQ